MKFTILSLLVIAAVILVACNKKVADKTAETPITEKTKPMGETKATAETKPEKDTDPETERPKMSPDIYKMVNFKKTPCYGKCPMYEVEIYTDGRATYHGKKFVEREGMYEARVSEKDLAMVKEKFFEVNFMDFANEYPKDGQKIADLPSTIIDFRVGDMIKQVKDQHKAPEKLKEFEEWMVAFIDGLEWRKVEEKKD